VRNRPPPKNYDPPPESNLKLYIGAHRGDLHPLRRLAHVPHREQVISETQIDTTWTIQANTASVENYEDQREDQLDPELTPLRTSGRRRGETQSKEPRSIAVLRKLPDPYETLRKGEPYSTSGQFQTGQYSLVVMNENKKPVKAKVKFKTS